MTGTTPFHVFERVSARVSRFGVQAGEEGEITRIFADGSIELRVAESPSPMLRARYGSLASRPPFVKYRTATFAPTEVRRRGER
jgi:hypothetical protein